MSKKTFTVSLVILCCTIAGVVLIAGRGEPVVVKTNLENLPVEIDGYRATEDYLTDSVQKELNADRHVYRHYRNPEGKQIDLYIGYYGTAKGGRTPHNPYGCLPGSGWGIEDSKMVRLNAGSYPEGVTINYILARKGESYESVLHWYQSAGNKVLSTGIDQNIERFMGRVFQNRNDGAFIRVSAVVPGNGVGKADLLVKSFAEKVLDLLPQHWPMEQ